MRHFEFSTEPPANFRSALKGVTNCFVWLGLRIGNHIGLTSYGRCLTSKGLDTRTARALIRDGNAINGRIEMPSFRAQILRLTLFSTLDFRGIESVWKALKGADPDVMENRFKEGLKREAGSHREGILEIQTRIGRMDVLLGPRSDGNPSAIVDIGFAKPEFLEFEKLTKLIVEPAYLQATRIAIGGVFLQKGADPKDIAKLFHEKTSISEAAADLKEQTYRVNRRTTSQFGDTLNRIYQWSTLEVRTMAGIMGNQLSPIGDEEFFLRYELDHSTATERTQPLEKVAERRDELFALMREDLGIA